MIPPAPAFVIAAAESLVGTREEGGDNRGPMIETFLRGVNQPPGTPWAAAFVHHVGFWSHFAPDVAVSSWPLPPTASCDALATFAKEHEILRNEPVAGDVFLIWHPPIAQFAHTGIVVRVGARGVLDGGTKWIDSDTIEGNSDAGEGRVIGGEMTGVVRRLRRFYPPGDEQSAGDRFIHWVDLDQRSSTGDPIKAAVRFVRRFTRGLSQ
jgi:hypothetical protein